MEERQPKDYVQPAMDIVELDARVPLLANSGGAQNDGYGEGIGDGDSGGWH